MKTEHTQRPSITDYGRRLAHYSVDLAFPRNNTIAVISAGAGWYAHQLSQTYGPGYLAERITEQFKAAYTAFFGFEKGSENIGRFIVAPLIVPWTISYLSIQLSLAASLGVSLTLNTLASAFFGIKEKVNQMRHPLNDLLHPPQPDVENPQPSNESPGEQIAISLKEVIKANKVPVNDQRLESKVPVADGSELTAMMREILGVDPMGSFDCC